MSQKAKVEPKICSVCGKPVETIVMLGDGANLSFPIVHAHDLPSIANRQPGDTASVRIRQCYGDQATLDAYGSFCMDGVVAPQGVQGAVAQLVDDIAAKSRSERRGIVLYGENGVGKSYIAAAACNEVIERGGRAYFVRLEKLIRKGGQAIDLDLAKLTARNTDLVVLDDFASERDSSFGIASVFNVVDSLYLAKTTLIVTTNLTRSQLASPASTEARRILDRLKERCKCVEYEGPNKRQLPLEERQGQPSMKGDY